MEKDYAIYDSKLAGLLMLRRCRLITIRPDRKDLTKTVFFFDNNDKFKKELQFCIDNKRKLLKIIDGVEI